MRIKKWGVHIAVSVCFVAASACGYAQNASLSAADKADVVNRISRLLADHYVFADTAAKMGKKIQQNLKAGVYNRITDPVVFSDELLKDLYTIYHDGHLLVQYNPAFARPAAPATTAAQSSDANLRLLQEANFGFRKAEILPGNIGYIDLLSFRADRAHGLETMKAALGFVAHTRALIIDLRSNGGGSQETATMLMGFFIDKRTPVESFYNRYTKETTDYWITPDTTYRALQHTPLYILTSDKSFSCAEMFAYDLQVLKRAVIIGEVTGGGAHGEFEADASHGFVLHIPYWRGINPVTKTNWEHTGVKPDVLIPADKALETAESRIFGQMIQTAKTPADSFNIAWQYDLMRAASGSTVIDTATLKKYAGVYGERTFTFEHGKLFYQRSGRPKFELEPVTINLMKGKGNSYFKIEFIQNAEGEVDRIKAYYQDNRMETAARTK